MTPRIKICGVRDAAGLDACLSANVDAIGFNFAPGSKRAIAPEDARALLDAADVYNRASKPLIVAVFQDQAAGAVSRMAKKIAADVVQLHGDEPPGMCAALGGAFELWKAVTGPGVGEAALQGYAPFVDAFLVDGRTPGSGSAWDWSSMNALLENGTFDTLPVWIAGGLSPENVRQAWSQSGAYGVDVASGVERDGAMDPARVAAFVRAARGEKEQ